jgi:nucleoside-diphosphate-sugar epimerase
MSRILITGGSGFIGTNVVEYFRVQGDDVVSVDVAKPRHPGHEGLWNCVDVTNAQSLDRLMREFAPEYVLHLAARTDLEGNDVAEYRANTVGVTNMIFSATRVRPKRIVFASTMLVDALGYKPRHENDYCPPNAYGKSKVIGETQIRAVDVGHLPWIIVRPISIWGPWFDVPYRNFFDSVRKGYYVHPGKRELKRSFGFVGNTVYQLDRLIRAEGSKTIGRTFYLGDYEATEVGLWAELIREEFGSPPIRRIPVPLMKSIALLGDAAKKVGFDRVPLTSRRLRNLLTEAVYDLEELRAVCGELPFDLVMGVRMTAAWVRDCQRVEKPIAKT